jgi:hypothetical protein
MRKQSPKPATRLRFSLKTFVIAILIAGAALLLTLHSLSRGYGDVEKRRDLEGRKLETLIRELGEPEYDHSFDSNQPLDEFRGPIRNTFPLSIQSVVIREVWWNRFGYYITVWSYQKGDEWYSFEAVRWPKDVNF